MLLHLVEIVAIAAVAYAAGIFVTDCCNAMGAASWGARAFACRELALAGIDWDDQTDGFEPVAVKSPVTQSGTVRPALAARALALKAARQRLAGPPTPHHPAVRQREPYPDRPIPRPTGPRHALSTGATLPPTWHHDDELPADAFVNTAAMTIIRPETVLERAERILGESE